MKSIALLIAAALALTACKAELKESLETPHEIVFSAGEVEDPATRTVFGTSLGKTVPVLWTANQKVDIFYSGKLGVSVSELSVTPSSDKKTAKFVGTVKPAQGTSFVLLSPAACYSSHLNSSATVVVPTTQTPTGSSPDEKAMILGAATGKYVTLPATVKFSPTHMTSYLCLRLNNTLSAGKQPAVTLTSTESIAGKAVFDYSGSTPILKAAASGSSNSITVNPTSMSEVWIACLPAKVSGKQLTIEVSGSAGKLTRQIIVPTGKNLLPGNIATLTVDMNPTTTVPVTGVTVSPTTLTLSQGSTATLTATVSPSTATDKTVTWTSSNTGVATVSSDGVVTGVKAGTATITATTNDGGKTATCAVTVNTSVVQLEAVDLGLSVKWANKNVGSDRPENVGDYISWGETAPKENYAWDTYKWGQSTSHLTKYVWRSTFGTVDNRNVLLPDDDAATVNLGGKWRLPTQKEAQELISQCTYVEKNLNGISGYEFTGKNGKTLFFPITCMMIGSGLADESETSALFWLKDLNVSNNNSWGASFGCHATNRFIAWTNRYIGLTVRAVDGSNDIAVSSITLNKSSLSLVVSGTETLTATVAPSTATIPDVVWSSSNTSVATVDYTGKVTALKAGTAVIKASSYDGGKTATCSVNVINNAVRVEFGVRVRPDETDYAYDADEDVFHMSKNSTSGIFTYYVYYADGRTGFCEGTWKLSVISGSGISISGTRAITCTEAGKTAVVRLSSDLEPGVYSDMTVKTWDQPTSVAITEQVDLSVNRNGILGWVKEGTTSRVTVSVQPSTARQKVVVWKKENDSGWTVEQTGARQFKITAPSVKGSTVSAYTAKAMTARFTCQTGSKGFTLIFTPTNLDLTQPKLLDYVSYNSTNKQYRIDDGGLRIQILASDGLGTQDFKIVSKPYPASGYYPVAIVTEFCPGQIPKNTIASTSFPYVNYYYADDLGNNRSATLTKGEFHGFAIALKDCDQSYWSQNNGDVDKSEHWNRSYGITQYSHMTKNAFDLTVLAAYHNGQLGSQWCIYPVDRVWRYPEPGFEYDVRAWPSITSYKMRPWVMPTVANFWMLRDGDGKLQGGLVIDQLNIRINDVAGEKIFESAKSYWTISTYSDSQAYSVEQSVNPPYPYGYNMRSKQWVMHVRPFMVF